MPPQLAALGRRRSALPQKFTGTLFQGGYRTTPTSRTGDPAPGVYCGLHFLPGALAPIRPAVYGAGQKGAGVTSSRQE